MPPRSSAPRGSPRDNGGDLRAHGSNKEARPDIADSDDTVLVKRTILDRRSGWCRGSDRFGRLARTRLEHRPSQLIDKVELADRNWRPGGSSVFLDDQFHGADWSINISTGRQARERPVYDRDEVIAKDYPLLLKELASLPFDRAVPPVLIKTNVCRLLEPRLRKEGFNVINRGGAIYFPGHGRQTDIQKQFGAVVGAANTSNLI